MKKCYFHSIKLPFDAEVDEKFFNERCTKYLSCESDSTTNFFYKFHDQILKIQNLQFRKHTFFFRIFCLFQIITNKELISVNQDKLGVQATCKKNCCSHSLFGGGLYAPLTCPGFRSSWQAWSGPLEHGDFVVIIVNRYDHDIKVC